MPGEKIIYIVSWLKEQLKKANCRGFVVGVSGGIDSAVTSTLAAMTSYPVALVTLPINQDSDQLERARKHIDDLKDRFTNVKSFEVDLTTASTTLLASLPKEASSELAVVNLKSRIRMTTLYAFANSNDFLVVGTGNKVEDYGVGFFTKYGDGGVDLCPIADLLKSEVRALAALLQVSNEIQSAVPTDGLWGDNRSDEEQIGATYEELEWAMEFCSNSEDRATLTRRQREVLEIYKFRHVNAKHKLQAPPVCMIPDGFR